MEKTYKIAEQYSEFPGLRHCSISELSGEDFYHRILNNLFKECIDTNLKLTLNLDDGSGYAPSFIDEALGNLVYDFGLDMVRNTLIIVSKDEPDWIDFIEKETYPIWEERRKNNDKPKITEQHKSWYRMNANVINLKIWDTPTYD